MMNPFTPGATVSRTVSGASASVALGAGGGLQVMVTSDPANSIAFIKFGESAVTAALTDTPILPGTVQVFTIAATTTHVAAIGTAGTLYFTGGDGA